MSDLLIFFDNYTFKNNSIVFNYIKRLLIYEILKEKYIEKKYENILLYKTNPSITENKLNINDDYSDIKNIIININNIIYKLYESYGTVCLKKILDTISNYEKNKINNKNNKIIIICSIEFYQNNFTDSNIKYINELIDSLESEIIAINITNKGILNNLFPKIKEIYVDIGTFKTENLIIKDCFDIKFSLENFNLYYEKFINISNNKDNKINIDSDLGNEILLNYMLVLNQINNFIIEKINNNIFEQTIEITEQIKLFKELISINFESKNLNISNVLKYFQNSLKDMIYRILNQNIKLQIEKLDPNLNDTYIKYILEFYEIIYPKLNNFTNISKIQNKKKTNNEVLEFKYLKSNFINHINDNDISCQYLSSSLSLSNWIEEYNNLNPFGFLISYKPNKLAYKGIYDESSSIIKTYPNMFVNDITTNWVSMYDYYQIILNEYHQKINQNENQDENQNQDEFNKQNKEYFNIGDFEITDNVHGNGNVLLPVYINKNHWYLTKSLWSHHMTLINNCFQFEYCLKMDNLYFYSLLKILNNLKIIDKNNNQNDKTIIRLFCYLLRTCIQILIDNKFLHSIKTEYKKYLNLVCLTENLNKNSLFSDWICRTVQLIVSNSIETNVLEKDLNKITTHIFNRFIIDNYKMDFWDMINDSNTNENKRKEELDNLKQNVLQENICWLYLEYDLKLLNEIIKLIYSIKGFNQFIKQIDKTNGCLEDSTTIDSINFINVKKIIISKCEKQFDISIYMTDSLINISKYISI
jgi:hypothetical protein